MIPGDPPGRTAEGSGLEFPVAVTSLPINSSQRNTALTVAITLSAVAVFEAPFAHVQLARIDAFIPVLQTVICVADLITAVLLFAQYPAERRPAILVLASGYFASGLFAFLQTLAFPGAYTPGGVIGDGIDSPAWLFVWWHTTFPAAIIIYALSKDKFRSMGASGRPGVMIGVSIACSLAVIAGLTWIATAGVDYLPDLYKGGVIQQTMFANHINIFLWLWGATALVVLFVNRRVVLDLWLVVTLFAWMPNFIIASVVTAVRFSAGWYTARIFALIASCMVLTVLLAETVMLYARLTTAVTLLRRERDNKLMNLEAMAASISHEVRQPLSIIAMSGDRALRVLERTPPDLEGARSNLNNMVSESFRAGDIFDNIRALFGRVDQGQELIDINEIVLGALRTLRGDLEQHGIATRRDLMPDLPLFMGHKGQLQEVMLNLVHNAVEAMDAIEERSRALRVRTQLDDRDAIIVAVEDTGPGIDPEKLDGIFDAFVTTKPQGMGLGLAICRMIIERHSGRLTASSDGKRGALFQFVLPIKSAKDSSTASL